MSDQTLSQGSDALVIQTVVEQSTRTLETYRIDPGLVQEHANGELRITQGGYGERQLFELVQNGADEVANAPGGRLAVVLTDDTLYCANQGTPVTPQGADTILRMSVSRKRGGQIGRFGVGVKSVLSVTDAPQFFSTSGCFGFDRAWSADRIAEALGLQQPLDMDTPVLRMARPLDREEELDKDDVLRELLAWATTVVKLPLHPGAAERLGHDITGFRHRDGRQTDAFPSGFQIFSSHVGEVLLEDRRRLPTQRRKLTVQISGERRVIREIGTGIKETVSEWNVFSVPHEPSAEARGGAGEMHDRSVIDVSWAVPAYVKKDGLLTVPVGRGQFWSYFPTKYPVSVTGYLNAAWKTNEDRQNLLDGSAFNRELLQVAARLVVTSLPRLTREDDPAAYLPLLPGRTKEAVNWAEEYFIRHVWDAAAQLPSLPDQDGVLRAPRDLRIHPEKLQPEWLRIWSEYPGRPRDWVHPSVDANPLRHGKMEHILLAAKKTTEDVRAWLEALVTDGTAESSCQAIRILAAMVERNGDKETLDVARSARIVLTDDHGMVAPVPGKVFHRTGADELRDDMVYVHNAISERMEMQRHLHTIGIRIADAHGRFQGVLDQGFDGYTPERWTQFWMLLRSAGGNAQVDRIRSRYPDARSVLHVRTVDGCFRPMASCLLSGAVVPADGSRDASIAVDRDFHGADAAIFRDLGLADRPAVAHDPKRQSWFEEYRQAVHEDYLRRLAADAPRTNINRLVLEGAPPAGPLDLLTRLSDEGRAAFVAAIPDVGVVERWTRAYGASPNGRVPVASPLRWMLDKHGLARTSLGLTPVREAVGPQLKAYAEVLPVVTDISEAKARRLGMPGTPEEVPANHWHALLDRVLLSEDDAFIGHAYALMLRVGMDFPEDTLTRCRVGDVWEVRPDAEIVVATSTADFNELVREQLPALLVAEKADSATAVQMIEQWGMLKVDDVISKQVRKAGATRPTLLVDEFPPLRQRLGKSVENRKVQRCAELEQEIRTPRGVELKPLASVRNGSTLLVLDRLSPIDVLEAADREFGWQLGRQGCKSVLELQTRQEQDRETRARLRQITEAESVIDKIALLIGEEELCAELPPGLLASEIAERDGEQPDTRRIAELAFNSHGEEILRIHSRDLARAFPGSAPSSFTGDAKALKFVTDLGLPDSFAGSRVPPLEARIQVEGPSEFPALHEYQEQLAQALQRLLDNPLPQRGMMSIPTGAGKTRVTSEAVIRWIRNRRELPGPVLWIAESEELCEQAVQSWRFVWSKVGAEMPLVISRLWSSNEAAPVTGEPHLVVATDAKLQIVLGQDDYAWLRGAALVIVDEAHRATSPSYGEIFDHLGVNPPTTRRHLVGLTATPYRNNEELTRRLVRRFGTRLDLDIFGGDQNEAIRRLQDLGVLAQVKHRELLGAEIRLSSEEVSSSEKFGLLPKRAEQRLAEDEDRNQRIIEEIGNLPADWSILVFATSVAHAKFLAAKLNGRQIRAAAIDSATPVSERRKRIEDFRKGRVQVLTNYGVLAQGFDAPATRAVVVARPTYSPNVYQQMIGRGLRGPKNNGTSNCLILNVRDNVINYKGELAFSKFDYLWSEDK
ncbi:DEAD/DEAH box helicase [Streptomyces sp. NRRL F-2890]|uniref:DEAD/DEAH box helicase n=1 Tax=Streptomyces sp. NRRL F-2890 TaxID=1463845 RepID=UPI0005B98F64|nr:DEAD/DEAH box helicase family protein [Streptomyces sp. NRRL F-2890]